MSSSNISPNAVRRYFDSVSAILSETNEKALA